MAEENAWAIAAAGAAKAAREAADARSQRKADRRTWVRAHRALVFAMTMVAMGALTSGGYLLVTYRQAAAAALVSAEHRQMAEKDRLSQALARSEDAYRMWSDARSAAAKRLKEDEVALLEVSLVRDSVGMGYSARVLNRSRYHVRWMSGELTMRSEGVVLPSHPTLQCCDEAKDVHGFGMGYSIAPGEAATAEYVVMSIHLQADSPELRKFAADNGIKLERDFIDQFQFQPDGPASFEGDVDFVVPTQREESGSAVSYTTQEIDFYAMADALQAVQDLKAARDQAAEDAELAQQAYESAQAALSAWQD